MPKIGNQQVTFWRAAARAKDLLYIVATLDSLMGQNIANSFFLTLYGGKWFNPGKAAWQTAGACVVKTPSERFVAVSAEGHVFTYSGGVVSQESITPPGSVTPHTRVLTAVSAIGGRAYACGMRREVFVRSDEARWQEVSAPQPEPGVRAGFEAIGGSNEEDIYAVGFLGEIWHRTHGNWIQRDSPVNLILTGVCCGNDGYTYICGQNATLIKGRGDQWAVMDHDLPKHDFWDIHAFGDCVYVASLSRLYQIKNDVVEPVDFGATAPGSCHRLTSADGVLWSVGAEDVFAFDGTAWQKIV
jgi:hypothetical protein